jgi:hypothetical protein
MFKRFLYDAKAYYWNRAEAFEKRETTWKTILFSHMDFSFAGNRRESGNECCPYCGEIKGLFRAVLRRAKNKWYRRNGENSSLVHVRAQYLLFEGE